MANERLIDLNLLRPFVGNHKDMQQQLLAAFEKELSAFHQTMCDAAINEKLETIRITYHRISPSLKILQQQQLIDLIEEYKQLLSTKTENKSAINGQQRKINAITEALLREIKMLR